MKNHYVYIQLIIAIGINDGQIPIKRLGYAIPEYFYSTSHGPQLLNPNVPNTSLSKEAGE